MFAKTFIIALVLLNSAAAAITYGYPASQTVSVTSIPPKSMGGGAYGPTTAAQVVASSSAFVYAPSPSASPSLKPSAGTSDQPMWTLFGALIATLFL
jgi:hypothetical protein